MTGAAVVGWEVDLSDLYSVGEGSLIDPLPTDWGPAWAFFDAGSAGLLSAVWAGAGVMRGAAGADGTGPLESGCCCCC